MPRPLSETVSVPPSLSALISTLALWGIEAWPIEASLSSLLIASQALLTSSRRNISLSLYSHFLIMGIRFSVFTERVPFSCMVIFLFSFGRTLPPGLS